MLYMVISINFEENLGYIPGATKPHWDKESGERKVYFTKDSHYKPRTAKLQATPDIEVRKHVKYAILNGEQWKEQETSPEKVELVVDENCKFLSSGYYINTKFEDFVVEAYDPHTEKTIKATEDRFNTLKESYLGKNKKYETITPDIKIVDFFHASIKDIHDEKLKLALAYSIKKQLEEKLEKMRPYPFLITALENFLEPPKKPTLAIGKKTGVLEHIGSKLGLIQKVDAPQITSGSNSTALTAPNQHALADFQNLSAVDNLSLDALQQILDEKAKQIDFVKNIVQSEQFKRAEYSDIKFAGANGKVMNGVRRGEGQHEFAGGVFFDYHHTDDDEKIKKTKIDEKGQITDTNIVVNKDCGYFGLTLDYSRDINNLDPLDALTILALDENSVKDFFHFNQMDLCQISFNEIQSKSVKTELAKNLLTFFKENLKYRERTVVSLKLTEQYILDKTRTTHLER